MTEEFTVHEVAQNIWHIEDKNGGVMYLTAGKKRALLIDTGWGIIDIPALVATLTPLPVDVVNTHGHRDHIGGNHQFHDVYIHINDLPLVDETLTHYIPIYDGYTFDLGNRSIRVIRVAGHTPGSICLLDPHSRILFSGDTPRPGPIWLHLETSLSVQEFTRSLKYLLQFADAFDTIAPSHGKPEPVGSQLVELLTLSECIVAGDTTGTSHQSRFGECLIAENGNAAILYQADRIHMQFPWQRTERLVSPEVHPDRTVTFRVKTPTARKVQLSSTPLMNALGSIDHEMGFQNVNEKGIWSLTVGPLSPDIYDYAFIIDGTTFSDPQNAEVQTGLSAPRSLLTVPSKSETQYHQLQDVPHGTVNRHTYWSDVVQALRHVTIYTPPSYAVNQEKRYPVLYLLHGGGDDDQGWTSMGRVHVMMDNLLAQGKAQPMVIVMPFGQAVPRSSSWDTQRRKNTPLFEKDLFTCVMPFIESMYRVKTDRQFRAIAGLSMGGGQTDHIGLKHLDTFSYVGILSANLHGFTERHAKLFTDVENTNAQLNLLFLGSGTLDTYAYESTEALHKILSQKGVDHTYWTLKGAGHTWIVWRSALYHKFLPLLFHK